MNKKRSHQKRQQKFNRISLSQHKTINKQDNCKLNISQDSNQNKTTQFQPTYQGFYLIFGALLGTIISSLIGNEYAEKISQIMYNLFGRAGQTSESFGKIFGYIVILLLIWGFYSWRHPGEDFTINTKTELGIILFLVIAIFIYLLVPPFVNDFLKDIGGIIN